ncbi:hypothetical protein ACLSC7_000933 [Enterococcus hirae]
MNQIAEELSFSTQSHFSTVFKKNEQKKHSTK